MYYFLIDILLFVRKIIRFFQSLDYEMVSFLQSFFPKDVYFFYDNVTPHVELIDAYPLFEYMVKHGFNAYYIIHDNHLQYSEICKEYPKNIISLNNKITFDNIHIKHFLKFVRCSKVFSAVPINYKSKSFTTFIYKNKFIDYIFLDHGITLLKASVFPMYNSKVFNKMLVNNEYEAELARKYMNYTDNNLIKVAFPRFERLAVKKNNPKSIFVFFTMRRTFRGNIFMQSVYRKNADSLFLNERLGKLLKDYNIELHVGIHHYQKVISPSFGYCDKIIPVEMTKISDYIKKSDLLITDYSSVWGDFLFQEKPVIFYRLDYHDPILNGDDVSDSEFAKSWDNILFNVTYNEEDTVNLIEYYIKNNFELEPDKKNIADSMFYTKNNICSEILKQLKIS